MTILNLGPVADDVLTALGEDPVAEARLRLAMVLFVEKRLSAGGAAEFALLSKVAFLRKMSERGVPPYELSSGDIERETSAALRAAGR